MTLLDRIRRSTPAAAGVCTAAFLLAGCTGHDSSPAAPTAPAVATGAATSSTTPPSASATPSVIATPAPACRPAHLRISDVHKSQRVLRVQLATSNGHTLQPASGVTVLARPVRPTAVRKTGPAVPIAAIVAALPESVPGHVEASPAASGTPLDGYSSTQRGKHVAYDGVGVASGSYRGSCGGTTVTGTFSTWTYDFTGLTNCPLPKGADTTERRLARTYC